MAKLDLILTVFAFVLFVVAAYPVSTRFNLIAAGLACLTATLLF
jgi:hypothetical protein